MQTFNVTVKWLSVTAKGAKLGYVVGGTSVLQKQYESHEALAFLYGVGSTWCMPGIGRYQVVAI